MADSNKVCFVITPIGDNNSEIRRHIDGIIDQAIAPAIGNKYEVVVAHRKYEIGSINDRIIKNIYESDLVIANLTNTNPNVMFELAIRYSFGKPAIVIAEKGTKLPFDVIDENTIFYINDPMGANELKNKIIEFERNIDLEKKNYGPVFKVINKIPLYNEVESKEEVSNEKLLQYVIDRLDNIEKNTYMADQKVNAKSTGGSVRCYISLLSDNKHDTDSIYNSLDSLLNKYDEVIETVNITAGLSNQIGEVRIYIKGSLLDVYIALDEIELFAKCNEIQYRKVKLN